MGIDYLLKDGLVIDGSAADAQAIKADISIADGCIMEVGDLSHVDADITVSAVGLIVCPGFMDVHAHSEFTLLADGRAEGKIAQGITTEINGNCGLSAAPLYGPALEQRERDMKEMDIKERWHTFPEYFELLEKRKTAVNFVTLAGHGNIRASVLGYADRTPSEEDMKKMIGLLKTSMDEGVKGFSTGLIYPPGIYSKTDEIIRLAREAAKYDGIYTTHMRSEGDALLESIDEVIAIAEGSGIRSHVSHLKTSGEKNWGKLGDVFNMIEGARLGGLQITCDRYPYTASSTDLDVVLPAWAFEGGHKKEIERLVKERARLTDDILREHPEERFWENVVVSAVNHVRNKWMEGKSIAEIARSVNKTSLTCLFDLLVEEGLNVAAVFFLMNEENLKAILKKPYAVIGTDSSARSFSGTTVKGKPHPRGFGSFPKVLGHYVREQGVLTLSEAIYKMSGLPAKIFRTERRGVIRKGYFADLVIFDPAKVKDNAGYSDPYRRPEGIHHVFVNGVPVVLNGEITGALPGRILR